MGIFPDLTSREFLDKSNKNPFEKLLVRAFFGREVTFGDVLLYSTNQAREKLFSEIGRTRLGRSISDTVDEYKGASEIRRSSPVWLTMIARNIGHDLVKDIGKERDNERKPWSAEVIQDDGGACVEASLAAEAAAHLLYSRYCKIPGEASSRIIIAEVVSGNRKPAIHAVLSCSFILPGGELVDRVADAFNLADMSRQEFDTGEGYKKNGLEMKVLRIIGSTTPIKFIRSND